ncbi:MAG: protein phosphatase 2C domain-containing protein [Sarcina sp.]
MIDRIFDCLSKTGKAFNEDICYVDENIGFLLDAATGLADYKVTNRESDGQWFVERWYQYLKENLGGLDRSLEKIMEGGIEQIEKEYYEVAQVDYVNELTRPSATVVIFRRNKDVIEYFLLGDSTLLIKRKDGEIVRVKDITLERLDGKVIGIMDRERKKRKLSFLEAKKFVKPMLVEHRLLKNEEKGYWVLEFEKEAISHGIYGEIESCEVDSLILLSDGYAAIYDNYKIFSKEELFSAVEEEGIEEVYKKIREVEDMDSDMVKYPRLKKGDDASIVYYKV